MNGDLEAGIRRIPGVREVKVVGDDEPTEIHVVAATGRAPKQIVRDIQSLALAAYRTPIDHRIVSVVQVDEPEPEPIAEPAPPAAVEPAPGPAPVAAEPQAPSEVTPEPQDEVRVSARLAAPAAASGRPVVLDQVVVTNRQDAAMVGVVLRWPDGSTTEGSGSGATTLEGRSRAAVAAGLRALDPMLRRAGAWIEVDDVLLHRLGDVDLVLVRARFAGDPVHQVTLIGSAVVQQDAAIAGVKALLDAINRKLARL